MSKTCILYCNKYPLFMVRGSKVSICRPANMSDIPYEYKEIYSKLKDILRNSKLEFVEFDDTEEATND